MSERFYITTPIYYVNDVPHIGHAYTTIAGDAVARWHRLNGRDVRFLTGTDEHGQKVMRAAAKLGRTPQEHVDLTVKRFEELWVKLDIQVDDFIRTTEPRHQVVVRSFLQKLWDEDQIYAKEYEGWYSTSAERFWTNEEVEAKTGAPIADVRSGKVVGLCPDSGQPVEWVTEQNYFFRMGAYRERLIAWVDAHPRCIAPETRKNEVLGFLRKPLEDLCISRPKARVSWGIPLPFDEDYVTYVWFDALTNYVSALGPTEGEAHQRYWPADVHLVGKDILTFHTVYWFSMLMALGLEPPRQVYAHGWWTLKKEKMSKSVGNVVDPNRLVEDYGADALRYFLLREIPFGGDGDYSEESFLLRYNSDLANDFGNLAHRSLTMAERYLGAEVPAVLPLTESDRAFLAVAERATSEFRSQTEQLQFRQALDGLWDLVRAGNKYIDTEAPWAHMKRGDVARAGQILRNTYEALRIAASHLWCVCPRKCSLQLARLGLPSPDLRVAFDVIPAGTKVSSGEPLFPRRDPPEAPPHQSLELSVSEPAPLPLITYDEFSKVALRIGVVVSAEKHPNADRLLVLQVDVGESAPRQIVAGIAKVYEPEILVGKRVVVVVNLAPAKLRGLESQGMLLAAGGSDVASLLVPLHEVAAGSIVK